MTPPSLYVIIPIAEIFNKSGFMDYEGLRLKIRGMSRRSKIYEVLREELGKMGYWKRRGRGNPSKGREGQEGMLGPGKR